MYRVWQVFCEKHTEFYIVNMQTKKVQSAWKNYIVANAACAKLNRETRSA